MRSWSVDRFFGQVVISATRCQWHACFAPANVTHGRWVCPGYSINGLVNLEQLSGKGVLPLCEQFTHDFDGPFLGNLSRLHIAGQVL